MEASIVGSVVGATIQVVLQNLLSLCADEIKIFRDFKKDLEKLKNSLSMVQAFLNDAEEKQVTSKAFKLWLKRLDAVGFEADDVLDKLNYRVIRKKMKNKVQNFFSHSNPILSRREMAHKIRDINEKLKSINKEAGQFGLQELVRAYVPTGGSDANSYRESDSSAERDIIGRENDVSKIVELLTNSEVIGKNLSVLPIVGMGGLGKTTLAKKVFNDERIENHFEKHIWVYVSQKFDDNAIFKKILESITEQKFDLENKEVLLRKVRQNLEAKRYLLVLDDVWLEEPMKLGDFMATLSEMSKAKGNSIIVTTRSENVASIVRNVGGPNLISKLLAENCWSIIKEKAFVKGNISSEFEIIGKSFAKRCQGLPLVAKVLGGMLRGKSIDDWRSIGETRRSDLGEDESIVMKSLRLSFDYLPSPSLKKCFAYCSIFPKGYRIKRELLIKLWMVEGFLQGDRTNDMEGVGNKYFELLLQRSLLQVVERDGDIVTTCDMHDLVHDLACSILGDTGSVRYIWSKSITSISKEEAGNLRSLIFEGEVHEGMFSNFKSLRVLILIGYGIKELPKIKNLKHLRFLDISRTRIQHLPVSIGNLYHLQTLIAEPLLKELPNTIKNLVNLRHLDIEVTLWDYEGDKMSGIRHEESLMLGHLRQLKYLRLSNLPDVKSIGSLLDGVPGIGDGNDTVILFPALKSLVLHRMPNLTELLTASQTQLCEVAIPSLECLEIEDCKKLANAPSRFPCLKILKIDSLGNSLVLENLLVNLTSLTELHILRVEGLVCLPDCLFHNNPNLSYLKIYDCPNLTHLVRCLRGGGAALRMLRIRKCPNLSQLPDDLHNLNSLERLYIFDCKNLKSITYDSVQGFTSLRTLHITDCNALTEMELPKELPRLETLKLYSTPHSFPIEIGSFRSLRDLSIGGVENYDFLLDQLQHLTALTKLELFGLGIETLPEWLGNFSSLQKLEIYHCEKLRCLPSKEAMQRLTKLKTLFIMHCPLLKLKRCDIEGQSDDDSEWAKISHIPQVYVYPPESKLVLKLEVCCQKERNKAMKIVCILPGTESVAMDMKGKKITVVGDVDPVQVVGKLKKSWYTELLTVGPAKEPEK